MGSRLFAPVKGLWIVACHGIGDVMFSSESKAIAYLKLHKAKGAQLIRIDTRATSVKSICCDLFNRNPNFIGRKMVESDSSVVFSPIGRHTLPSLKDQS